MRSYIFTYLVFFFFILLIVLMETDAKQKEGFAEPSLSAPHQAKSTADKTRDKKYSSDGRYVDNLDGTISDRKTGMMWTKKDSHADLSKCLDWNDSVSYVRWLRTGGYEDWRLPTVSELKEIFEPSKSNIMGFDHDIKHPLHLDSIFADGAAYSYWSSQKAGSCCALNILFTYGYVSQNLRFDCYDRGVRAIRETK